MKVGQVNFSTSAKNRGKPESHSALNETVETPRIRKKIMNTENRKGVEKENC
jgi:hypothetical protein